MDRIEQILAEGTPIDEGLRRALREAMRRHRLLGQPVVGWRDGQVVWIPPEEIPVDDEPPGNSRKD